MGEQEVWIAWGTGMLALARIAMVFVQAPIWGSQHFKAPVKMGMAASVTLLAMPNLPMADPAHFPTDLRGFIPLILMQLAVGLVIGWVSFLVMATAQFGGEMLDIQMGLSVAAQSDPSSHGAVNLLRRLHFYIAMLLYLLTDGHHELWRAIFYSFKVIPLTEFHMSTMHINVLIDLAAEIYVIGLQISSPAVGALFITQIALGLVARVAPQMNVFMLSFPMNISVGMILLTFALPYIIALLNQRFEVNLGQLQNSINMMRPGAGMGPPPSPSP